MVKSQNPEIDVLKRELVGLFDHIQRIRREIAAIRRPGAGEDEDHFHQMSDELDAIVAATEGATDTIMENAERIEDLITSAKPAVADAGALAALEEVPERTAAIFEACAFQDITGQRITKVVKSLKFIEARVNALINMWGAPYLSGVDPVREEKRDEWQRYLNGPQLSGHGVSQADVDAMFGTAAQPAPAPAKPAPPAAPAKPAPTKAAPAKPAPAPAKPAAPVAPTKAAPAKPAPTKPAPTKAAPAKPEQQAKPAPADAADDAPKLDQNAIDALFG